MTGVEQLLLTGAGRHDSYNYFAGDSTWSAGLIWSPIDQVRIKANKSTSYVVPTPREALIDPVIINYNGTAGTPIYDAAGNFTGMRDPLGLYIYGGNPDLQPETAATVGAGVEFTPETMPGLSLGAYWHETIYRNRIGQPPSARIILGTDYVGIYHSLTRDEETGWLNYDTRAINFALVEVAGVDYRLRYNWATAFGQYVLTANVGHTRKYERTIVAGSEPVNEVANVDFRSRSVIPAYRYSLNLGRYHRGLSVNLDASTASKTVSTDTRVDLVERVGKAAVHTDLLLAYDFEQGDLFSPPAWLERTAISLKILNVLDDHPEYQINDLATGEPSEFLLELNSNLADPRGRMFHLGITKRF
jgi:outer membrane receptor protein involved in Fe transport